MFKQTLVVIASMYLVATLVGAIDIEARKEALRLRLHGYQHSIGDFGHNTFVKKGDNESHTVVEWERKPIIQNRQDLERLHKLWLNREKLSEEVAKCQANSGHTGSGFFEFLAAGMGAVGPFNKTISFKGRCFDNITVTYTQLSETSVEVNFQASNRNWNPFCLDYYLIGHNLNFHLQTIYIPGNHKLTLKNLDTDQWRSIDKDGLHIFGFCDSAVYLIPDLAKTVMLFLGGLGVNPWIPFFGPKPPSWMVTQNVAFVKAMTGYQWQKRKAGDIVTEIDEEDIHDGDFLAITRFDGLDQFVELATGAHNGHCTVAMRINGTLYILESQAGWYWPKINIQRTPYKEWVKFAHEAGFNVALLPMREDIRKKFNTTAALEWYRSVEGLPYGYHNFLFAGLDTEFDNLPPMLDVNFTACMFNLFSKIIPTGIRMIWDEAINVRLGTKGLQVYEQYQEVLKRNTTFGKVWAVVEKDGTVYSDGLSYVCSGFVAGLYKAGGLFGDMEIQATEFTPKDLYLLNFFDKNATLPANCKKNDPDMPYCILMGEYIMDVREDYGSVDPYPHMNERCPSMPPTYARTEGC